MADTSSLNEWFNGPQGMDSPGDIRKFVQQKPCAIGFEDSTCATGFFKLHPDSQSPRVTFSMTKDDLSPTVVFGFQHCIIEIDVEEENTDGARNIGKLRTQRPLWFKGIQGTVVCIRIKYTTFVKTGQTTNLKDSAIQNWKNICDALPKSQSVTIIAPWRQNWKQATKLYQWILMLHEKIQSNRQSAEEDSDKVPTCFWYYYQEMKKLEEKEAGEEGNEEKSRRAYVPAYPWLAPTDGKGDYVPLAPIGPYFIDDHERRLRLEMAMEKELEEQRKAIEDVFNFDHIHKATLLQGDEKHVHLHVIINSSSEELSTVPNINEGTEVGLFIGDLKVRGETIDVPTEADLVVEVESRRLEYPLPDSAIDVKLKIKPNLTVVKNQIKAIKDASQELVVGDKPGNLGKGFSLLRTVLAHGSELNAEDPNYFVLDAAKMSGVEEHVVRERLAVLEKKFQLDDSQRRSYTSSVRSIIAGVSLIQGPPGTGKTHVAVAIIVTLACLGLKVLLAAGSNKAVDNVSTAIANFLDKHPHLNEWCGILARARTPTWQLALLRDESAIDSVRKTAPTATTDADKALLKHQVPKMVLDYAKKHLHEKSLNEFVQMYIRDQTTGLHGVGMLKGFKHRYEVALGRYLQDEVRVLATTLSNSAHESLQPFRPDLVVCDESGQCLEGDHMIAMTRSSVRAVVLIGDPEQLPPTLISENSGNPEANYAKRSLMERLQKAGYPCAMLKTNYRCHPHILDMFNRLTYDGQLKAAATNSYAERVGNVWTSFAQGLSDFRKVSHRRRIFLNCPSAAVRPPKSSSLENRGQIKMAFELLKALYSHRTVNQERIVPSDVMLISPYKAHKKAVTEMAEENDVDFNENLTIDASQGQEAEIVIYMLVRPSDNPGAVGFVADKPRLNVALSRAKKLLIIIGDLNAWDEKQRQVLAKRRSNKQLVEFLNDVAKKRDAVNWTGAGIPAVSTTVSLPIMPSSSERPLSKRREKSPSPAEDVEQAPPKRQRLMPGSRSPGTRSIDRPEENLEQRPSEQQMPSSSISGTVKHGEFYKLKSQIIIDRINYGLKELELYKDGLRRNVMSVEQFRREESEILGRVDNLRGELSRLTESELSELLNLQVEVEGEVEEYVEQNVEGDVEMEDQGRLNLDFD